MSQNNFYFGFTTFEEFLAASLSKTVYISKSISTRPVGDMRMAGVQTRTWHVTAGSVEKGVCHYFRLKLGSYDVFGEPFPEEKKYETECQQRGASAQDELSKLARDNGFSVIHALTTFPENLIVMCGHVSNLEFDKEANLFKRKEIELAAEAQHAA